MTQLTLTKKTALRLVTMLEAGLISYKELHSWTDWQIEHCEETPHWIFDLSVEKYSPDLSKVLRGFAFSDPPEVLAPPNPDDEELAALYLRYERRDLSWASFLRRAGDSSDASTSQANCEFFYELLDELEEASFSQEVERRQQSKIQNVLAEQVATLRPLLDELLAYRTGVPHNHNSSRQEGRFSREPE